MTEKSKLKFKQRFDILTQRYAETYTTTFDVWTFDEDNKVTVVPEFLNYLPSDIRSAVDVLVIDSNAS